MTLATPTRSRTGVAIVDNPAVGVLALTAVAITVRLLRLLESPEPCGTDGYYYLVQAESLLRRGHLHAPDGSWVLGVCALFAAITPSTTFGVKLASALLAGLCVPAAGFAGARLAKARGASPILGGGILALWAAASPTLTHLAGDFPKTLGAAAPLFVTLGLFASPSLSRRGWVALAAVALLGATAHRLGAGLLGLGLLGALAGRSFQARAGSSRGRWLLVIALLVAFAALTALLPNLLRPIDLERLRGQLMLRPHWPPPPWAYFRLRTTHPLEVLELSLCAPALGLGLWAWLRHPERRVLLGALILPLSVCLLPLWRTDVLDAGYRFALMAPLLASPLWVLTIPQPSHAISPRWLLLAAMLVPCARFGFDPQAHPPYALYRRLIARIPRPLPELLIAHTGLNFLYDHEQQHDAMAWAPEPGLARERIGRIVWGVRLGEWMAYAPEKAGVPRPVMLGEGYSYVREDLWEAFLGNVARLDDDDLEVRLHDWRNPLRIRPASLLRNHLSASDGARR